MRKIVLIVISAVIIACFSAGCATNVGDDMPLDSNIADDIPVDPSDDIVEETTTTATPDSVNDGEDTAVVDSATAQADRGDELNLDDYTFDNSVNPLLEYLDGREAFPPPPFEVDVDFTTLTGEEYAEAYANFLGWDYDPIGKTLRVVGQYSGYYDEVADRYYHFVIMDTDLTGCCMRSFEFDFSEGNDPGEYPEDFTIIDVAGVYDEYYDEEYDWSFQHLIVDGISVLSGSDT